MGLLAERQRPLRRVEYERMIEAGLFRDERVELIRGVIVQMSPQNAPHAAVIQMLTRILMPALVGRADVRVQLPLAAGEDSLPEPDVAVVEPLYSARAHPDRAFLVIEAADSSLESDRHEKAHIYAGAGVPEYWVVNLVDGIVEVYTEPSRGAYTRVTPFRRGEIVRPQAFADVGVSVSALFGG